MGASITYEAVSQIPRQATTKATRQPWPGWRGLGTGLERGAPLVVAIIGGLSLMEFNTHLVWFVDFLIGFLLMGALYSGLNALVALLWKLFRLVARGAGRLLARWLPEEKAFAPYRFMQRIRGQLIGAVLAPIGIMFMEKVQIGGISMISQPGVTESLIPFLLVASAMTGVALMPELKPGIRIAAAALAVTIVAMPAGWYLWPGTTAYLSQRDQEALAALAEFRFENPGLPGQFEVQTLTYGSGQARRHGFGTGAELITRTVDPTAAYEGWTGTAVALYRWTFGFDFKHLPLAGTVWYPEGNGPFPLVMIVHGNHGAADFSDPGYAYLGWHFASRGFITASVDENFLNGYNIWDGKGNEMPVRAWLLLKHLQVWRDWNGTPGNPFYGKVDLDRVVLMGHSRGGEAVAHAAMLNEKLNAPVTRLANEGDFGFGIRGVVAIAPADGQWKPLGKERRVVDVSYLLIQGGHDQDLSSLEGIRQYNRVKFESNPDAFKAVAYIYRANHGNFNTVWASNDHGVSGSMILNRAGLLDGEEQRAAARVFMTSFLEATLNGRDEYRKIFVSPAGARKWLPEDIFATQYEDATFKAVATHERPAKVESADVKQPKPVYAGLVRPTRPSLVLRDGQYQQNSAFLAEWTAGSNPSYTLALPKGKDASFTLQGHERLAFELGNAGDEAVRLYVIVELVDASGSVAIQPANRYGVVPPLMPVNLQKSKQVSKVLGYDFFPKIKTPYERVLQSFEIPLSAFVAENADFDPTQVTTIRFRFNDEDAGKVYVDEIGFRG